MISGTEQEETNLLKKYSNEGNVYIYQNTYNLPIGFMVSSDLEKRFDNENLNPFMVQNSFVEAATGYASLFTDLPTESVGNMLSFTVQSDMHVFAYVYSDIENVDVQINNLDTENF